MKHFDILTIFPEYFKPLEISLIGRAAANNLVHFNIANLRNFAPEPHHNVDDTPYGGGAGMVMRADVLAAAIDSVLNRDSTLIFTTPAGQRFTQSMARQLSSVSEEMQGRLHEQSQSNIIFVCGRFEGYDDRLVQYYRDFASQSKIKSVHEFSIGDYVLNGGEVAALAMIESIVRLIPGVIGNPDSLIQESHELIDGVGSNDSVELSDSTDLGKYGETLLEYPNYTRPANFRGLEVPAVLLSGNHAKIDEWRLEQARKRTKELKL